MAPGAPLAPTVLVVDDEELNRHLYGSLLTGAGFRVELARDGEDAIAQLRDAKPDIVLLDFLMPRVTGPEVLRWMRGTVSHGETPVVLLTASGDAEHVAEAFDAGADDYLLKPINPRILLARVRSTIAARQASLRARQAEIEQQRDGAFRDRLLTDLEEARAVQLAQAPAFPITRGSTWFSGCVTSSGHVGGDLVDVVDLDDGSSVAILVDVAGHGTGAALIASSIRAELRFLLGSMALDRVVVELGRRILADGSRHVCIVAVQMRGDAYSIVNAGLPPVWIGTSTTPRELIASSGPPPGLFESNGYTVAHGVLTTGEVIALVSDGLTEPFGFADEVGTIIPRLLLELEPGAPPQPEVLGRAMLRAFRELGVEERPDDATALVIGRGRPC